MRIRPGARIKATDLEPPDPNESSGSHSFSFPRAGSSQLPSSADTILIFDVGLGRFYVRGRRYFQIV